MFNVLFCCQQVTRVKKIDEEETEGTELSEDELVALSQGT